MRTDELDYALPAELIAQTPAEPRDAARLLVHDRATGELRHRRFADLLDELDPDDLVVHNDTRVLPVRLHLRRASGGRVELLLLERAGATRWRALARPYRRLGEGEELFSGGAPAVRVVERAGEGEVVVAPANGVGVEALLERAGEMPLPPYVHAPLADPARLQTVYAREPGSAAAPTAGLHFTRELWERVCARHEVATVTLQVGLDTFRPVAADDLAGHRIHSEAYAVAPDQADAIGAALAAGRRVVAVGTTTVRVLETIFGDPPGPLAGRTGLFITPPWRFRGTGALLTNFHVPRSTLLALVMAFAGVEEVRRAYREAIARRYRFLSLGDACLFR
jgi:S-adenosylmethionine:tRNA ribosyltransferase-isomerase